MALKKVFALLVVLLACFWATLGAHDAVRLPPPLPLSSNARRSPAAQLAAPRGGAGGIEARTCPGD